MALALAPLVLAVPQAAAHNFYVLALEMRACLATMRGYFEQLPRSLLARMLLFFGGSAWQASSRPFA